METATSPRLYGTEDSMKHHGYEVIGKGLTGWHAKALTPHGSVSSSSYDPTDEQLRKYLAEAREGALVYDASEADGPAFTRFVINGPILELKLPPGHVHKLVVDPGTGLWEKPRPYVDGEGARSMDGLATDLWEAMLRKDVPGVRFGRVTGNSVLWESPVG